MLDRECKLNYSENGIGKALDTINNSMSTLDDIEVAPTGQNELTKKRVLKNLDSAISTIKKACNITSKDSKIGIEYPWDSTTHYVDFK